MSTVAVTIPARDASAYLAQALDSVLGQRPAPVEVVVVDDGSRDDTAAIAAAFGPPVRVVSQERLGIATAVNRAIESTSAPLLAMLDADDVWTADKLALQLAVLERDPDVDAVFGHASEFISPELGAEERAAVRTREIQPFRAKSTMLVRRSFVDRVGPFDTALATGDFVDWYTRAEDLGLRAVMLDEVVLRRRIHTGNHGRGPDHRSSDYVRIARRTLQRRREASQ